MTDKEVARLRKECLGGQDNISFRYEHRIRLEKPKQCSSCKRIHSHSEIVACKDNRGGLWFQCHCGSTLFMKSCEN